ncbi:hypothetical protein [Aestuariivita boseongensis]|uniref:hypothetical protein n=1 Tax=Aestuariivita boseongensis TaxID=1470562 RepID=UPI00068086A1|nr:hypothetical protein [Aestuariivita boseongensis]
MKGREPYDPEDFQFQWEELLLRWSELNEHRFHELGDEKSPKSGVTKDKLQELRRELLREWWALTAEVLFFVVKAEVQGVQDLRPKPLSLLSELARVAEDLGAGISSPLLQDVVKRGRSSFSFDERKCISIALYYLAAVGEGRIEDRSPNKTVRSAFDVSGQTVRDWQARQEEICAGMPGADYTPYRLKEEMLQAGKLYQQNSRSQTAILNRNRLDN